MTNDDFTVPTPELAECAKINFENLERMAPQLKTHPFYRMAKEQLDAVCERLSAAPREVSDRDGSPGSGSGIG